MDWEKGESGVWKSGEKVARCDFAIQLVALVEADQLTGFQAKVTRQLDHKSRWVHSLVIHRSVAYCHCTQVLMC